MYASERASEAYVRANELIAPNAADAQWVKHTTVCNQSIRNLKYLPIETPIVDTVSVTMATELKLLCGRLYLVHCADKHSWRI